MQIVHFYSLSTSLPSSFPSFTIQRPVSQKSRNFSDLFRVPQFPSYLRNAEALSHQTSQSSCFFYVKNVLKGQRLKTGRLQFDNGLSGPEKFSGLSRNRPQACDILRCKSSHDDDGDKNVTNSINEKTQTFCTLCTCFFQFFAHIAVVLVLFTTLTLSATGFQLILRTAVINLIQR